DQVRDLLGTFDLEVPVVDDTNGDLFVRDGFADDFEIHAAGRTTLERQHVDVQLVQIGQRLAIRLVRREQALLGGIPPACMAPGFGDVSQSLDRVVEYLYEKFDRQLGSTSTLYANQVDVRFLHLDDRTSGRGELQQLFAHGRTDVANQLLL